MFKRYLLIFSVLIIVVFSFVVCSKIGVAKYGILVKNGKIIDGTGNPWFHGDIGIKGDTIAEIGDTPSGTILFHWLRTFSQELISLSRLAEKC